MPTIRQSTDRMPFRTIACVAGAGAVLCAGCGDAPLDGAGNGNGGTGGRPDRQVVCNLPQDFLYDGGVARDAIPALVNPGLVPADAPEARYLDEYARVHAQFPDLPETRVAGLVIDGEAVAIPHNILWWHEIVHLDLGGRRVAITYCPLTGSAIAFDASRVPTERFGVSGLVFMNNLMMFDAETESLWPQMVLGARCGRRDGAQLSAVALIEMRWDRWKELHPNTRVVSSALGHDRNYTAYPYDLYEAADELLLFPMPSPRDRRRRSKERVLGIRDGNGGLAIPFGELETQGALAAVSARVAGRDVVVLWDAAGRAAQAYEPASALGAATITVEGNTLVDRETGSRWSVEGLAVSGPRAGERLVPILDAFVSFWFAWSAFYPETLIWAADS